MIQCLIHQLLFHGTRLEESLSGLKSKGGLSAMQKINKAKAESLYSAIDSSDFYSNPVSIQVSIMDECPIFIGR